MRSWITAAIIGLMIAALHYWRSLRGTDGGARGRRENGVAGVDPRPIAALLRAIAAALVAATLLGAPSGPPRPLRPLVALDASASWTRGDRALAGWRRAVAEARRVGGGDTLFLFGDSLRAVASPPAVPADRRSNAGPALDAARDARRPLVLLSDGEFGGGAVLPPATRLKLIPHPAAVDAAVVGLVAPTRAAPGDTITLRLTVRAGSLAVADAVVSASFATGATSTARTGPLGSFAEREVELRVVAPGSEREELLRVVVSAPGDVEPRNDTLATVLEISRTPAAVLVSSSPDPDARGVLEALAGALAASPRGFYQVAPGAWRDATTLRAVSVAQVRAAASAAPLLVVHGDTAVFGPPAQLARSALVLMVPGETGETEWRAVSRDGSPLSPSLASIAWDSIPPIELPPASPRGDWVALEARGNGVAPRAVVAGGEANGRRRLVVAASGLWRWRARGGPARDAYDALWGAIADWTTGVAIDVRAAIPAKRWLREGDPVHWLRTGSDSVVNLMLRATGPDTASRALILHFSGDARTATTPALPAGRYTATMRGGSASFIVNASEEMLPLRPPTHGVARGVAPAGVPAPPLGERWWAYVLAIVALCGEWIIRRRAGLR